MQVHASANIADKSPGAESSAGCLGYFRYREFYRRNKTLVKTENGAERKQEDVYNFE